MKKLIFVIIFAVLFSGCATMERKRGAIYTPKSGYDYNFATSPRTGILRVECRPPSQQLMVDEYVIKINNEHMIQVSKHSDVDITLDEGTHDFVFFGVPSGWKGIYGEKFGKEKTATIDIKPNQMSIVRYYGPYTMWSDGELDFVVK